MFTAKRVRLANGFTSVQGKLYISRQWFCFRESKLTMRRNAPRFILQLPISEIVTIQRAQAVKPATATARLEFVLKHELGSFADSLLVYGRDGSIHQFWSFWSNANFEDTFNCLDAVWRPLVLGQARRVPDVSAAPVALGTSIRQPITSAAPARTTIGVTKPGDVYARGMAAPAVTAAPLRVIDTARATFVPDVAFARTPAYAAAPSYAAPSYAAPISSIKSPWPVNVLSELRSFGRYHALRPAATVEHRYVVVTDESVPKHIHKHRHHRAHRKERPTTGMPMAGYRQQPAQLLQHIRTFNKRGMRHILPRVSYLPTVYVDTATLVAPASVSRAPITQSPGEQYWAGKRSSVVRAVRQEKPHLRHVQPIEKHGLAMSEEYSLSMPSKQRRRIPSGLAREITTFSSSGMPRLRHIGGPMERPLYAIFEEVIPERVEYAYRAQPSSLLSSIRNFPRQSLRHVQVRERPSWMTALAMRREMGAAATAPASAAPAKQWTLKQPGGLGEITLKGWLLWPSQLRNEVRSFDQSRLRRAPPRSRPMFESIPEDLERTKRLGRPVSGMGMGMGVSAPVDSTMFIRTTTVKATFVPLDVAGKPLAMSTGMSPRTSRLSAQRSSPMAPRRGL